MSKTSLFNFCAATLGVLHLSNTIINNKNAAYDSSKAAGKYYHWRYGDIFYKKIGEGSPILLVHDLTVYSSSYEWNEIVDSLSKKHTVYTVDMLGCGKSEKSCTTYTNYFYIQMISDFIKEVIKEKTTVAATGLSINIVLLANALNKELFDRIIMISPKSISSSKKMPDERSKILMKLFQLPIIGKAAYYIATCRENVEYYLTEKCFYNPFKLKKSVIHSYYSAAHSSKGNGRTLLASIEGYYLNADITNALKNADKPLLMINGAHNENVEELEKSYRNLNPEIECKRVSKAKMLPQLETPEEFLDVFCL